jgi:hypothetical protein
VACHRRHRPQGAHPEASRKFTTVTSRSTVATTSSSFSTSQHKGAEALISKLSSFAGVLVADAEHRHNALFEDGRILEAGCNAHGRRKMRDAESVQPVLAKEAGAFIAAIFVAEAEAQKRGLTGDALRAWRKEKVPPIQADFLRWMDAVEPTLTPSDSLAAAIRYYRNHWEALFRFVDHPDIPLDNSASEREYQQVAKDQAQQPLCRQHRRRSSRRHPARYRGHLPKPRRRSVGLPRLGPSPAWELTATSSALALPI